MHIKLSSHVIALVLVNTIVVITAGKKEDTITNSKYFESLTSDRKIKHQSAVSEIEYSDSNTINGFTQFNIEQRSVSFKALKIITEAANKYSVHICHNK
jgi:hypothetical protein